MTTSAATTHQVDTEFERLYQQAYYRHSGFGPDTQDAPARRTARSFMSRPGLTEFGFAALALVFFVVPAVAAAALMA